MADFILEMKNITKEFPGVKALDAVDFKVKRGEILCLVGENGAGKSTLMKVLSGVHPHGTYTGDIVLNGEVQEFSNIKDSEKVGIAIIYQELALIPEMSVYENIFLGNEIKKGAVIDWNETILKAQGVLKKVNLDVNPDTLVKELGVGKQQLIEIAKQLAKDVKLLILDEPTAALNDDDSANLLEILKDLRNQGITCIMISHKLNEVMEVANEVTVLRDGQTVATMDRGEQEIDENEIVRLMVGRELTNRYPARDVEIEDILMEVKNWNVYDSGGKKVIDDANFYVRRGEIIGMSGLMGAGRTELAMSIFGKSFGSKIEGDLILNEKRIELNSPKQSIEAGINYLTEDRKEKGLILIQDIKSNIALSSLQAITHRNVINDNEEIKNAEEYRTALQIKTPSVEQKVMNLSGGNQQKVVLSKCLLTSPDVLIVDEPTRGIDVGSKYEIYGIMNEYVSRGKSIIMISSELPEIIGMSDRVYVMFEGKLVAEIPKERMTQEEIMKYSIGQGEKANG